MTRGLLIGFLSICLMACSGHYYRVDKGRMTLVLKKPGATRVLFFCSLDGYAPRSVTNKSGRWLVELPAERSFRYFYRVEDRFFIPDCSLTEKDDFGFTNCIYEPDL